tara:strand:- start:2223 stop:2840 length:618 start_codon:yes stop_codon:yes gene_type:complete
MIDCPLTLETPFLIGYYGYITMPAFVFAIILNNVIMNDSFNNFTSLIIFSLFIAINQGTNGLLKQICQQSRPENPINIVKHDATTNPCLGMPSGHAQSVMFATTYLYFYTKNPLLLIISGITSSLTISQRLVYRKHTPLQLFVGGTLGIFFGYTAHIASKYLHIPMNTFNFVLLSLSLLGLFYIDRHNLAEKKLLPFLKSNTTLK